MQATGVQPRAHRGPEQYGWTPPAEDRASPPLAVMAVTSPGASRTSPVWASY